MLARPASRPPAAASHLVAERLSDRLAAKLSARIDAGELRPGDRLPPERLLALEHGVSRTVVREAVHQLKSRGLLNARQGLGVFVSQAPPRRALDFDMAVLDSIEAVVQVREVRRALEGESAALAAERATRAQVQGMRAALRDIDRQVAAGGDGVAEDLRFHRIVAEATGNPQFVRLLEFLEQYLQDAMRVTRGVEARRLDFMDAVRKEHRALVDAIAQGDAAAARRCALRHMAQGERRLHAAGLVAALPAAAKKRNRP